MRPENSILERLKEEALCYLDGAEPTRRQLFWLCCTNAGFQLNLSYRLNRRVHRLLARRRFLWVVPGLLHWCQRIFFAATISPEAIIGRRLRIYYGMGIVIGARVVVGDDARIFNGVTLGSVMPGRDVIRQPKVGNRVFIGSGAKVLGGIEIGDDVRIGANSVVLHSAGSGVTVVGVPGRVVAPADAPPETADGAAP